MAGGAIPTFDDFVKSQPPSAIPSFAEFSADPQVKPPSFGANVVKASSTVSTALHPLDAAGALLGIPELQQAAKLRAAGDNKGAAVAAIRWLSGARFAEPLNRKMVDEVGKSVESFKAGEYGKSLLHVANVLQAPLDSLIPGMTQGREGIQDVAGGDVKGGGAKIVGGAIDAASALVGQKVPGELAKPGTGQILKGGAKVVGGTGVTGAGFATGHPIIGAEIGVPIAASGVADIVNGIRQRAAARTPPALPEPTLPPPLTLAQRMDAMAAERAAAAATAAPVPPVADVQPPPLPEPVAPAPAPAPTPVVQPAPVQPFVKPETSRWQGTNFAAGQFEKAYADMKARRTGAPAAPASEPVTPAPEATPTPAPAADGVTVTPQEAEWLKKRTADTAAKDDVIAQHAFEQGITKVEPGQAYADLVGQANKAKGKKYQANITRADHADRVKALNEVLASKHANAAAAKAASALREQGVTRQAAANMTAEQWKAAGVEGGAKAQMDVLFEMQKLEKAPEPVSDVAQQLQDSLDAIKARK